MSNVENTIWTSLVHKRWLRAVIAMASVVVFVTVYSLILPAAALTGEEASQTPGMDYEASTDAGEEVIVADGEYIEEIPVDDPNYTAPATEEPAQEPAAEPAAEENTEPQTTEAENSDALTETDDAAAVENSEEAAPEAPVTEEVSETQATEPATEEAQTADAPADTSNEESATEEVQTTDAPADASNNEGSGEADPALTAENAEQPVAEQPAAEETAENAENAEEAETEETEEAVAEETAEETAEEETAPETPAEVTYSAGTLVASVGAANVTVTYDESAQIADGASLVLGTVDRSVKTSRLYETVFSQFTSISIADADGNEIAPAEGSSVSVSVEYSGLPDGTRTDYAVIDGENEAVESFNVSLPATIGTVVTVEKTFAAGTISYEGDGYQITLKYGENAKLPENCTLQVSAVEKEVEVDENVYEILLSKFMALSLVDADGNSIVPANDAVVNAEVTFNDVREDAIRTNYVIADAELKTVDTFDITLPGTIGTVFTAEKKIYEDGTLAFEGEDFKVVLAYNKDSGIPKGSKLDVTEIKAETKSSDGLGYDEYRAKAEEELDKKDRAVKNARFFDIKILDKKGNEIEPTGDVKVSISQKKAEPQLETENKKEDVQKTVVHFTEEETKEIEKVTEETVEEIATGLQAVGEKLGISSNKGDQEEKDNYTFETDSFSVYGIIETNEITVDYLTASGKTLKVSVNSTEDYELPRFTDLSINEYAPDSAEYKDAYAKVVAAKKAEDENFDEENFGFTALDISLYDKDGNVFEPDGSVSVKIEVVTLPKDTDSYALTSTMEVQHLEKQVDGSIEVKTVATPDDVEKVEGTVTAEFVVDSFSTFALTWSDGGAATIHWGKIENGTFVEFDAAILDSSAESISLANYYDGYEYVDAVYYTTEPTSVSIDASTTVSGRTFINTVLTREYATGSESNYHWLGEDSHNNAQEFTIANGSHIYAVYQVPEEGSGNPESPADVAGPTTTKKVTNNGDGTYTIQLDVTGAVKTETSQTGANVIVVFDNSGSMSASVGSKTRLQAAKDAVGTLVTALNPGTNDIDMALVYFAASATKRSFNGSNWTKNGSDLTSAVNSLNTNAGGTNWNQALQYAYEIAETADNDPTYIIFVTDGCPSTNSTYSGHGHGSSGTNNTSDACYTAALAYAKAIAGTKGTSYSTTVSSGNQSTTITQTGLGDYLYGIYTGTDNTNLLNTLISSANGVQTITATSDEAITNAFKSIAQTIINNLGSNNVSVDDGLPEISSVSATVVDGQAGGFEYYKATKENPTDSDFETWTDAPGASYSSDNGVTWDLSEAGVLADKTTYRLKFTVWPSQAAYDLIADLNNGLLTYGQDYTYTDSTGTHTITGDEYTQYVKGDITNGYYMLTNTHLETTYTYNNTTYTDPNTWESEEMPLPTEKINIVKKWNNPVDSHIGDDTGNGVKLILTKDGENYLYGDNAIVVVPESEDDREWESTKEVYISMGSISKNNSTNKYLIKETGHDYTIAEPAEYAYYWDLISDIYHPMVINGTPHILIQNDDAEGTDGVNYYIINGHKYEVKDGDNVLEAINDRRSNLNLTKAIDDQSDDQGADKDTLFEYTITVNNSNIENGKESDPHSDYYVWFSVYDPENTYRSGDDAHLVDDATLETSDNAIAESGNTGYFYVPSGQALTVKIKEGWNLRFLNLPIETTYSITENVEAGWEFEGAAGSAWNYETDPGSTETYSPSVSGTTVSGNIPKSNRSYTVTVTNKWEPSGTELTVSKAWASGTFVTTHGDVKVALFKEENGTLTYVDGSVRTISAPSTSVKYDALSSLEGFVVREVIETTATETVEGEDGTTSEVTKTTYNPVDANGLITVNGETTTLGSNAADTYVVTYATGEESTSGDVTSRTDTVTNTMPQLTVNKQDMSGNQLKDAVFKLTGSDGETALTGYGAITSTEAASGNLLNGIYLSNGTYYLVETEAPAGYNKLTYKVKIVVKEDTKVITAVTDPESTTQITDQTSDNNLLYTFNVNNSTGVELPHTGGPGTLIYTLSGLILLTGSVIGLSMRRRERRLN